MAKNYVVENGNAQNDKLLRAGTSKVYRDQRDGQKRKNALKDENTKKDFMDWLFSGPENKEPSPLK